MMHPVIIALIDDHLQGVRDTEKDREFLKEAAQEFYVATIAEANELFQHVGATKWDAVCDKYCARIGFLRATNALARAKMGKPWRPARTLSS